MQIYRCFWLDICGQRMLYVISVSKIYLCHQPINHCSCPQHCTLRGVQDEEKQIVKMHIKEIISRSLEGLLPLPLLRKVLKSLPRYVFVCLISSNLLMFDYLPVCLVYFSSKNSYIY